jgi:hypothetical protein
MRMYPSLVALANKMAKRYGTESANNIIAGMMLVKKDYLSLTREMERYLKEN